MLQLLGMGSRQSPGGPRQPLTLWTGWIFTWQLREIASNMVQLQRALNELSEEHNTAMAQSQEKQRQLEKELHAALQDKVRGPWEWWVPPWSSPIAGDLPTASRVQQPGASCPFVPAHGEKLCNCQLLWEASPCSWEGIPRVGQAAVLAVALEKLVSVLTGEPCLSLVGFSVLHHAQSHLCPQKCSEEKIEILQGKISLLEDQLAKLEECSTQEKGEVMGDILKVHWGSCSKGLNGELLQLERAAGARRCMAKPCGAEPAAVCCWIGDVGLSTLKEPLLG